MPGRTVCIVNTSVWVFVLIAGSLGNTASAVNMDMVTVGNPGNAGDTRYASPPSTPPSFGAVGYTYQMGKFEVTAGQYTAFLNAVAKTDTYDLYSTSMDTAVSAYGCNVKRSGSSGNYSYSVASAWANRPVNVVSWGDAARFANWMHNGKPTGPQSLSTTEDGSYYLNGATSDAALLAVTRKPNATWVIPSEDEWYKVAYYDLDKPGGAGYWDYPTRSNTTPSNVLDPTGTNNANFYDYYGTGYSIGAEYYRTEVGEFSSSHSAYGTFDQGGNVWEWNETNTQGYRGLRGGSFDSDVYYLGAVGRHYGGYPTIEQSNIGFRLAEVPEPATILTMALAAVGIVRMRRV